MGELQETVADAAYAELQEAKASDVPAFGDVVLGAHVGEMKPHGARRVTLYGAGGVKLASSSVVPKLSDTLAILE